VLNRALADLVLLAHLAFVLFVACGGLLVLRRPKIAWLHLPAAAWGVWIEFTGWICPLTPLEVSLRLRGGESGYAGGFISHYVAALLYPAGLTRGAQIVLGLSALLLNVVIYSCIVVRGRRRAR
jgi:hypothetical protein